MMAWTSPAGIVRFTPLRISRSSMRACRLRISRIGVVILQSPCRRRSTEIMWLAASVSALFGLGHFAIEIVGHVGLVALVEERFSGASGHWPAGHQELPAIGKLLHIEVSQRRDRQVFQRLGAAIEQLVRVVG